MRDVVIVDGVRSAIGKFGGGLSGVRPDDLFAEVYKGLIERTGVDPAIINDVFNNREIRSLNFSVASVSLRRHLRPPLLCFRIF